MKNCLKVFLGIIIILSVFSFIQVKATDYYEKIILEKTILSWEEKALLYNLTTADFNIYYTYDKQLRKEKTSVVYDYLNEQVSGPIIHEGDKIVYTIKLENVGTETLNTEITDQIQIDLLDYISSSETDGTGIYTPATGIYKWTGSINPGETVEITIETKVKQIPAGETSIYIEKNTANVKVNDINITPIEDEDDYTVVKPLILTSKTSTAYRQGDLNDPIPNLATYVHQGDYIVYTITVKNAGQVTEKAIKVFDPINTTILKPISQTATAGDVLWNDVEERFEWTGTLAPGGTAVIKLTVEIEHTAVTGTYVIMENVATVQVNGEEEDPVEDDKEYNVSDYAVVTVKESEVYDWNLQKVEKTGASTIIHEGDIIRYVIFVDNSEKNAVDVEITDQIQIDAVEYINSSATYLGSLEPDGIIDYNETTGILTWTGNINPEETVIIVILVKVKELPGGLTSRTINGNVIDIKVNEEDKDPVKDEDEYVVVKTDVSAVKTSVAYDYLNNPVVGSLIHEGDTITYTIEVTNNGMAKESYVVITDNIDIDVLEYINSNSNGDGSFTWNAATGELKWEGSLDTLETIEITIETKVKPIPEGETSVYIGANTAQVKAHNEEQDPAEDDDDYTVVKSKVTTSKTSAAYRAGVESVVPADEFVHEGDKIVYTITAKNEGDAKELGIEITDDIHLGLQYVSSDSEGKGVITIDGTTLTWKGDLIPGEIVTITITTTVKHLPQGVVELHIGANTAAIKVQGEYDDPIEDEDEYDIGKTELNVTKTSDVYNHDNELVEKTGHSTVIHEGYEIVYTIILENIGSESATTEITDELQDTVEYIEDSATSGTTGYNEITRLFTWSGIIEPEEIVVITIRVKAAKVSSGTSQTITGNVIDIEVNGEEEDPVEDEDEYVVVKTDVSATKTSVAYDYASVLVEEAEPGITLLHEGDKIVYTIEVVNNGIETEDEVIITDNINIDALKYINSSSSGDKGVITWDEETGELKWAGSLISGESVTITIETEVKTIPDGVSSVDIGKNTAQVKANNEEQDPAEDDEDYKAVIINIVTTKTSMAYKSSDGSEIPPGTLFIHEDDLIVYTITVTNAGEAKEKVVELLDPINIVLLEPIEILSSADIGVLSLEEGEETGIFSWTGELEPNETATIILTLKVREVDITKAYTIGKNRVTIKVGDKEQDPVEDDTEYNVGFVKLNTVKSSDVYDHQGNLIMKTGKNTIIHEGDEIIYTIIVENEGNEPSDTVITDILQTEVVEYISSSATYGLTDYDEEAGIFSWSGILAQYEGTVITIVVKAKDVPAGQISQVLRGNTIGIESNGEEEDPVEDESDYTIAKTDVTAVKTSVVYDYLGELITDTDDVHVGDKIIYTITVTNNGIAKEKGVVITDDINIAGLDYEASVSGGKGIISWNPIAGRVTWVLDLDPEETANIAIIATVVDLPPGEIEYNIGQNVATLKANDVIRDPIEDPRDYTVKKSNVVISKTSSAYSDGVVIPAGEFVHEGDIIEYTITVENNGAIREKNILITDLIDKDLLEYDSHSSTKGNITWDNTEYKLEWIGTLNAGESAEIILRVKVRTKAELPNGFGIESNVITTRVNGEIGTEEDPNEYTVGKINIDGTKVSQAYDIDGNVIGRTNLYENETIDYVITLNNTGNESGTIILRDLLPAGLTIIDSPDLIPAEIAELISPSGLEVFVPAEGSVVIRYTAKVTGLSGNGNIRNSVKIDDTKTIEDEKTYKIIEPIITVEKTSNAGGNILKYEDKIVYTIKVTLEEGNVAKNVVIRDKIPTGTTVSNLMDADRIENGDVVFELGDIEGEGEYVEVSFEVQITTNNENGTANNLSQITNIARVTADNITGEIESNTINIELEQYTVIPIKKSLVEERTEEVTYYYPAIYANGVDVKQNETVTLMARSPDGQLICTVTITRQNKEYKIMTVTMNRTDIVLINGIKTVYTSAATLSDPVGAFASNPTHIHNWYPGGYPGTQVIPPSNYYVSGNDAVFIMLEDVVIHTGVYEQKYYKDEVSVPGNTFKAHISGTTIYGEAYEDTIIIPAGGNTEFINVPYGTYTVTELDMDDNPINISGYDVLITTDVNDPLHGYTSVPSLSGITAGTTVPIVYINNIKKEQP